MIGLRQPLKAEPKRGVFIDAGLMYKEYDDDDARLLLSSVFSPDLVFIYWTNRKGNLIERIHANSRASVCLAVSLGQKRYLDLDDEAGKEALLREVCSFAGDQHYDALYIDYEPVRSGDKRFIRFLTRARELSHGMKLGAYGFRLDTGVPGYSWDVNFLKAVLREVDFATISLFNFNSRTSSDYRSRVRSQIDKTKGLENIFFIMPAFRGSGAHDPTAENIHACSDLLRSRDTLVFSTAYWTEKDMSDYSAFLEK